MAFKKINDILCKDSTVATLVDFSDVDPITQREFKTSALNGSEYFTSLEMSGKSKSQMILKTAIHGANIASKLFDELSHSNFNFGEFENSTDFSISTKVNSLMADATDMDEKFAMMEQTIRALKKSIDDKNLQIAQLMSKLDLYNSRESHHNLTTQEKIDIDSSTKPVDFQNAKRSASVATLTVQQLQDMIVNTIKAQYGGPLQSSLGYSKSYSKRIEDLLMPIGYQPPKLQQFDGRGNSRQHIAHFDSDVSAILDELLTKKVIALPESKESNKVDDPMYCKFHCIIGHHTTKCFILKEKIMTLIREGNIIINDGETAETNHASVKLDHKNDSISEVLRLVASPKIEEDVIILQFGSFEPVEISASKKITNTSKVDDFSKEESCDTWTLVALKRQKYQGTSKLRLSKVDTKSSTNQLRQCESIKSNTKSKYINASSQRVRRTVTLMEFFPEMLLDARA
ncbi:hypothetical protein R3W88_026097 [Solanum pinnatisectum]|uniref:Uncharacterized protein n=1 Tax=Solanum pinnatisectum TaxID=50273 RepID=A0AAV9LCU8_9SOLN|nr:hypothetical protein R3W88_026097 [Solanum pinnatisectum]